MGFLEKFEPREEVLHLPESSGKQFFGQDLVYLPLSCSLWFEVGRVQLLAVGRRRDYSIPEIGLS